MGTGWARCSRVALFAMLLTVATGYSANSLAAGAAVMYVIERPAPTGFGVDQGVAIDDGVFRRTQVVLLQSDFVLSRALADSSAANLPAVERAGADALKWLKQVVSAEIPEGASVLRLQVASDELNAEEAKVLAQAIDKAYTAEVIYRQRAERLRPRDILVRTRMKLEQEIQRKSERLEALRLDFDKPGETKTRLLVAQVGRLEAEVLRLEDRLMQLAIEAATTRATDDDFRRAAEQRIAARIEELRGRINDLTSLAVRADEVVTDLKRRGAEIRALDAIATRLRTRAEELEVDAMRPDRVTRVPGVESF